MKKRTGAVPMDGEYEGGNTYWNKTNSVTRRMAYGFIWRNGWGHKGDIRKRIMTIMSDNLSN